MKTISVVIALAFSAWNVAAALGPDYTRPTNAAPADWKSADNGSWKIGEPQTLDRSSWWELFGDAQLNALQAAATENNQGLRAAFARINQARATARVARSYAFPVLGLNPSARRERTSPNMVVPFPANGATFTGNNFNVPLDLSYEIDIWGRVRRSFESARAEADAAGAAFETVLLGLRADLAINYFALRALDTEITVLRQTLGLRNESLTLGKQRFEAGAGTELDVARSETELASAEAELAALTQRRAALENAIAVLVGENPSNFKLPENAIADFTTTQANLNIPVIPPGLPSDLLERRPDVAEAERALAAANARIGVAKAAFFPSLRLTGSGGFLSGEVDSLFNWDSRAWSIGPSLSIPLFAAGRDRANLRRARARHEEAVALYRERVLVAFADVENSLTAIQALAQRADALQRAVTSARRGAELARTRFDAGFVGYLEVIDAERVALQIQRGSAQLAGEQLAATVQLIKALGGGWHDATLLTKAAPRAH